MRNLIFIVVFTLLIQSCVNNQSSEEKSIITEKNEPLTDFRFTIDQADSLAKLPLFCMQNEYPNKLGQVLGSAQDLGSPKDLHPAFYGCFDWHSSVHGHWMLVWLIKNYPDLSQRELIIKKLKENISSDNIEKELNYFKRPSEKLYERTYGWAWLLKLSEELHTWDHPAAKELESNLKPLTDLIVFRYMDYLPKLVYPIRVGEHSNSAFGLSFAWDYAQSVQNDTFKIMIKKRAEDYFLNDKNYPLAWEPSGHDFLSPALEEIEIMRRVLKKEEFIAWLNDYIPEISKSEFSLSPGIVKDKTDGKLVHIDGLNFSRAWCLYGIANQYKEFEYLRAIGDKHLNHSLPEILSGAYAGEHWLASFAIYAISSR